MAIIFIFIDSVLFGIFEKSVNFFFLYDLCLLLVSRSFQITCKSLSSSLFSPPSFFLLLLPAFSTSQNSFCKIGRLDFFLKDFIYLFIHEKHRERGRDLGRRRSRLPAGSLMQDLIPGSSPEPKADRCSSTEPPRYPSFIFLYLCTSLLLQRLVTTEYVFQVPRSGSLPLALCNERNCRILQCRRISRVSLPFPTVLHAVQTWTVFCISPYTCLGFSFYQVSLTLQSLLFLPRLPGACRSSIPGQKSSPTSVQVLL